MPEDSNTILKLEGVTKKYRTKGSFLGRRSKEVIALNNLSLAIRKGEVFGLVGESGSGKTTAGRLIVRLETPEAGRILLDDRDITHLKGRGLKAFRRRLQMIFQDPYQSLNAQLSVYDTVHEPLAIHRIGGGAAREEAVLQVLKAVGLSPPEDFLSRYPHQLSGGQRQRVAIARAMVLKPDFVVADEPTSMLDASISAQIFNILLEMRDRVEATLMFITHSLAAARYLCDRIAVIYRGNLMELGPADEVIQNPKHPYTRALIDALPKFGHCGDVKHYGTLRRLERRNAEKPGCVFFPRCNLGQPETCGRDAPAMTAVAEGHSAACFYLEPGTEALVAGDACFVGT